MKVDGIGEEHTIWPSKASWIGASISSIVKIWYSRPS